MWRSPIIPTAVFWLAIVSHGAAQPPAKPPTPAARPQRGTASYFGAEQSGKLTASGEVAKPGAFTAASRTLPLGTTARVVNAKTGKAVNVTVVDHGPYAKHRVIDVSSRAATRLGMKRDGVAPVKVRPLHVPKRRR